MLKYFDGLYLFTGFRRNVGNWWEGHGGGAREGGGEGGLLIYNMSWLGSIRAADRFRKHLNMYYVYIHNYVYYIEPDRSKSFQNQNRRASRTQIENYAEAPKPLTPWYDLWF